MTTRRQPGIYVEILIDAPLERVWELTQEPGVHQRWDLRFTNIEYLPRPSSEEPQRFLYETRIGAGLAIRGTGESIATRTAEDGSAISSLRFASDDALSLIHEGAGYWRYIPTSSGLRFLTWYDYRTRFGRLGYLADRTIFRPLMGWATAWSFDRMRLWAEHGIPPELSLRMAVIHAMCRTGIAFVWLWHGLVPKLIFKDPDEQAMLLQAGVGLRWLPWIGGGEILMGILVLALWRWRSLFLLNITLMIGALAAVLLRSPAYLSHAFNPMTLNLCVALLAGVGYIVSAQLPSARRCLRVDPREKDGNG
ncbi:DoxX-like family protein [Terriglobus roseus]|uniref:DoxX-like family protein n=1 Tax=Terriglobus roseus TaxID=392734 RepID=A0A1H4TC02_9BACT|nr:DoxX-like family protein [Terriglobus roseus]SEC53985.1 DoxX-like family protein [Terriglobus roseus]